MHDEEIYPDSYSFKPERFIRPDGSLRETKYDPELWIFGFGRRCVSSRDQGTSVFLTLSVIGCVLDAALQCRMFGSPVFLLWPRSGLSLPLMRTGSRCRST